ncbi:hypothetical protein [Mycobacteroides chelonae]|uniref:hypothetical protein n=1 Tax=Mycobacteroides chelonae TaxID=1774 RepID=UPI000992C77F|nr:hypothetical protein [Mycobacteroides chelonae]
MSLLDSTNADIIVYMEESYTDSDENTMLRASKTGIPTRARIQPASQSGTSSRRAEQDNEGFETEKMYRLRFPRSWKQTLGSQAQIDWNGKRWSLFGDVTAYIGSPATRHNTYIIWRG